MIKKLVLFWLIGSVVGLYTTFVLQNLWNWFVTAAFHVSEISFWVMYGIVLIIGITADPKFEEQQRFKSLTIGLDACLPDDKREMVNEQLEEQKEGVWLEVGSLLFGKILGNSFTLLVGWAIHVFFA